MRRRKKEKERKNNETELNHSPNPNKLDIHIHTKTFLERRTLHPTYLVRPREHLVGKGDLLVVTGGEEAYFVDHPREGTCGVGATAEAEDADSVVDGV